MKKLIALFLMLALSGLSQAELANLDFEAGADGWGMWGSGSGSGPSGYAWMSHWAYVESSGGVGDSQFMNLDTTGQIGYTEYWGWGYNIVWRSDYAELMPVAEGQEITIGGYAKDLLGDTGAKIEFKFEWLDINQLKDQDGGIVPAESIWIPITSEWAYYEATLTTPTDAYWIRPCWANGDPGKGVGIDNLTFVPEPMTIALLGLGGLFIRRRKA